MSETQRFVAYYRMPSIGDRPNGGTLACQRRDVAAFLNTPERVLVGEFTEVMTPAHEGETSPAFDLGLECCRSLNAKLICALSKTELAAIAREKAARDQVDILLIRDNVVPPVAPPEMPPDGDSVPYLRFGRSRRIASASKPDPSNGTTLAGNRAKADQFAAAILPVIDRIMESGTTSLTDIAAILNARDIRTARGKRWYPTTVKNILERRH